MDRSAPQFAAALAVLALATVMSPATLARAAPNEAKAACLSAHESGQLQRNQGHTREARRQLAACARPECPALVERDCASLLSELEMDQPTLLLEARDARGNETLVLHVFVDGARVDEREGVAVPVDPGEHTLRIELPGHEPLEQRVVARPREKNRRVVFPVPDPPPATPPIDAANADASSASTKVAAWVFTGVAVAAIGSFAYFAASGKSDENHDAETCRPNCTDSQVATVRGHYIAADVSLGVAAVSTAAAVWFFLHRHAAAPSPVTVSASPSLHGASAHLEVAF